MNIKKIFITGATGYIGGSVAHLLLKKGYQVTGLVRKESMLEQVSLLGINPVLGDISNLSLLRQEAEKADAVINMANADESFAAIEFVEALSGSGKTFINTSGTSLLAKRSKGEKSDFVYTEDFPLKPDLERAERVLLNNLVLQSANQNIRSIVIAPPMVYGTGLGINKVSEQLPLLEAAAHTNMAGVYIGKGENIWSNVHVADVAELFVLALEKAAAGSYFYAENGEASLKQIAESTSKKLGFQGKTISLSINEAIEIWGPAFTYYGLSSNSRVTAAKARKLLGWEPKYNSILTSIETEG